MAPLANTTKALQAANAAAAAGVPYSNAVQTSGVLAGFRADCSGFVDYVLAKSGYSVGGDTTVTLPSVLKAGTGPITVWDRPGVASDPQSGHVIIDILGKWFESGGGTNPTAGGGPAAITPAEAKTELAGGGFSAFTPKATSGPKSAGKQSSLAQLWIQAGGDPKLSNIMSAIAMAESSGNQNAIDHDSNGSTDYGLWQINSINGYNAQRLLSDPLYNAQAAVAIERSQGLGAWTTYKSGAYLAFVGTRGTVNQGASSYGGTRPGGEPAAAGGGGQSGSSRFFADYTKSSAEDVSLLSTAGGLAEDASPLGPVKELLDVTSGGFNGIFGDIFGSGGIISDGVDFMSFMAKMFNPYNWLRGVEFLTGLALMGYGLNMMMKSNRRSSLSSVATRQIFTAGRREHESIISRRAESQRQSGSAKLESQRQAGRERLQRSKNVASIQKKGASTARKSSVRSKVVKVAKVTPK